MATESDVTRVGRGASWAGYAAFAWGAFFAAQHLYWILSGRFGPGRTDARSAHDLWSYAIAEVFSVLLFTLLALFPLALIWRLRWIGRRRLQIALLAISYGAMILLNLSSFLFSWSGPWARFGLYPLAVCLTGVLVAFVRPPHQSIPYWMILVATWACGVGMTLYGGAYLYLAFHQSTADKFLGYLLVGGMNWTVEGLLFVATAWLASRERHHCGSGDTGSIAEKQLTPIHDSGLPD